jgi:hypothetical protein
MRLRSIFWIVWLEVLTAVTMKMAVFWVVAPCRLVRVYRRFEGLYSLHHQGLMTSETLLNSYQSTRRYNPEDGHLYILNYTCFPDKSTVYQKLHTCSYEVAKLRISMMNRVECLESSNVSAKIVTFGPTAQWLDPTNASTLKMANAVFSATLDNCKHSTRFLAASRSYTENIHEN